MDFFFFPRRVRSLQTFIDSQWSKNWAFLVLKCTSQPKCSVPMCHSVSHTHKFKSFSMLKIVKLIKTNALKIHWKRINFNFHTFRTEFPLAFFFCFAAIVGGAADGASTILIYCCQPNRKWFLRQFIWVSVWMRVCVTIEQIYFIVTEMLQLNTNDTMKIRHTNKKYREIERRCDSSNMRRCEWWKKKQLTHHFSVNLDLFFRQSVGFRCVCMFLANKQNNQNKNWREIEGKKWNFVGTCSFACWNAWLRFLHVTLYDFNEIISYIHRHRWKASTKA